MLPKSFRTPENRSGRSQSLSGPPKTVPDAPKVFSELRKPFRMLPKSFRRLRKPFRTLPKSFRRLRKHFGTIRRRLEAPEDVLGVSAPPPAQILRTSG